MTEKNQPEKKKKTFLLKKRIEDAQNYTKSKTDGRGKTLIPADSKLHLKSFVSKVQYQLKTENEENDQTLKRTKTSIMTLESQPTITLSEFQGPQLKINKKYLSFLVFTGFVSTESIEVSNNGSTAIYYEWNRVEKTFLIQSSLKDNEERFYCHHVKKIIIL